jgi:hypothetical protein
VAGVVGVTDRLQEPERRARAREREREVDVAAVLGVNAVFHDPAASIVVDGQIVAAAEEERFSRRRARRIPVSGWSRRTSSWSRAAGRTP